MCKGGGGNEVNIYHALYFLTRQIAFAYPCQLMSTQSGQECMPNDCNTLVLLLNISYRKWLRLLFGYCAKVEGRPNESKSHLLLGSQ